MKERPEWVLCILRETPDGHSSLCGRADVMSFSDAEGWLHNRLAGGRHVGCPDCLAVIAKAAAEEVAILESSAGDDRRSFPVPLRKA
jgi:uncharacterized protein (DUF1810 family)